MANPVLVLHLCLPAPLCLALLLAGGGIFLLGFAALVTAAKAGWKE